MVLNKRNLRVACTPTKASNRNKRQEMSTSTKMKVYIRVRPHNSREETLVSRSVISLVDDRVLVFDPKENEQPFFFHGAKQRSRDISRKQNKEMNFVFDRVFAAESTNLDVFESSICGIFGPLLEGYNCSVFVYGATGAGKTFTMLGNDEMPGVITLTMRSLFEKIEEIDDKNFDIGISYLEVYNENVHDLLNPSSGTLHLREDQANGVTVAGLKLVQIKDAEQLFGLLKQGNANRTQHPTDANAESSRSHAVFQVFIKMKAIDDGKVQLVKLSLIDLAGSERAAATNNCNGLRLKEGANINKSLLALGNCINNLADGVRHIPYRDSKLTRLLKDSLGGNCQTVMIACVGPTALSYEDTYNTLKYAARARTIKTKIAKNILNSDEPHIGHYRMLSREIDAKIAEIESRNEQLAREVQQLRERVESSPAEGDLSSWIQKLVTLFSAKKSIHEKILQLESEEKITRWRIKHDHERVHALDNSDDGEDVNGLAAQVSRLESTLPDVRTKMNELWERKMEMDDKLSALRTQMIEENVMDLLAAEVSGHENAILQAEAAAQHEHFEKLLDLLYKTNVDQQNAIKEMAEQYQQHHNLLRDYNKITGTMTGERKDLKSLLTGKNTISWAISPTSKVKKRFDSLTRYASLSADLLHKSAREECPFFVIAEDNLIEENILEQADNDVNSTFVVDVERTTQPIVVESSQTIFQKKESMKENMKLPRVAVKRQYALPLFSDQTPKLKTPRRLPTGK